jgi:hypothetical protein
VDTPAGRSHTDDPKGAIEPSPALAMVLALCERLPAAQAARYRGCRDRAALQRLIETGAPGPANRLVPLWSYYTSQAFNDDLRRHAPHSKVCSQQDAARIGVWSLLGRELGTALIYGLWKEKHSGFGTGLCIPQDTFTVADLVEMASRCAEGVNCEERQLRFLAGRMVFYGVSVTAIHDEVNSPVLGYVPGVALHAAAAANLLQYGTSYIRMPPALWGEMTYAQVVEMALTALAGLLVSLSRRSSFLGWVFAPLAFFGIVSAVIVWEYFWLNWPPANWLALWLIYMGIGAGSPRQR